MELRHLRYFDAVATARSFSKAAELLGVSQPPLSRQIQELEKELGVDLFDRGTRPVELTMAGRLLHDQCARILAGVDQIRESICYLRADSRRVFTIGVVGSIMQGALPAMIRKFREQLPEMEVDLVELTTIEQVAALKDGRIDVGLGRIRIDDPLIRREILYEESLIMALPANHRLALEEAPVSLSQLQQDTLIIYPAQPRPSYADQLLSIFRDIGSIPKRVREVREIHAALGLVASEAGVAIVPDSMRHIAHQGIVYRPVADDTALSPVLVSQRLGDGRHSVGLFLEIGRKEFGSRFSLKS